MNKPLVIVSLCVLLGACADVTGPALEVNGQSFSRSEVNDFLGTVGSELAADESAGPQLGSKPGTVRSRVAEALLNLMIQNEVVEQRVDDMGIQVTQADIDTMQAVGGSTGSVTLDRVLAELNARGEALRDAGIEVADVLADLEVSIDPRFGTWDPVQAAVVANQAAAPAPS